MGDGRQETEATTLAFLINFAYWRRIVLMRTMRLYNACL